MTSGFADPADPAIPLYLVSPDSCAKVLDSLDATGWAETHKFSGAAGSALAVPGADGAIRAALVGTGSADARARGRFLVAGASAKLPAGAYRLTQTEGAAVPTGDALDEVALGWLLDAYRFDRYHKQDEPRARLVAPDGIDAARIVAIAEGEALTRDLINTPANDMGPADLEAAARALADRHGAVCTCIVGDDLLERNFPLIHTVGRAAAQHRAPRLIDMSWGPKDAPLLTLVGKGVCFDTGGLNLKPGASMGSMKKDMGGAAAVLGLAHMIMATAANVRLRVLIPAVENAVGSDAFRPQDILTSRKGLTVEINNTDAEGRLVLADALALAGEDDAGLTISVATLTGAARVAVGPDLAPFFAQDDDDAASLIRAGTGVCDPLWRLPFHAPYEAMIEPGIADLDNAPKGGHAGAITAALFLRRFAPPRYVHFDIFGSVDKAAPGRPKGGAGQGTRAIFAALPALLS